MKNMKWVLIITAAVAFGVGFTLTENDYFFKINKSIDLFGRVYKEVTLNYVDDIDPEKFMESGIDGLLGGLDPYTNFIDESEGDEVELITTGKYGGIGVTIGVQDNFITIISLMDGYTAQRQGLQPGDRIIEVDGKSILGMKPENVRSMTRGEAGTDVKLKIEREGETKPLEFTLVREGIQLKNITYADYIDDGIAYIKLERFTRGAGDELRLAIKDLKLKGTLKGVILDLRGNPGGLLDVAVDILEKFVPKGSLLVSTRGRKPESEKKYFATEEPMLPDVPVAVLVNRNSASASEIVAGALQDLDRAVIMGTRSFGKGLVQTISPLPYNTQLKITTAKYYTPSGRCIQEIDYEHKNKEGVFATTPDSLRHEFKTLKGRPEFEAGGITPDSTVKEPELSSVNKELLRKAMYFKFATKYVSTRKDSAKLIPDGELLQEFSAFTKEQGFEYESDAEQKLGELRALVDTTAAGMKESLVNLERQIKNEKDSGIDHNRSEVLRNLKTEIMSRYGGESGRIAASFEGDRQLAAAKGVLHNAAAYSRLLSSR
jgi:carboxyl-terminal processing protease